MSPHLSTLALHRLRYGELDAEAHAAARSHIAGCDRCRGRLGVQQRTREEFVLQRVPAALRESVRAAPPSAPGPLWSWLRQLVPLLAVAATAVTFVAVPALREAGTPAELEVTRTKGDGPELEIWVDRGGVRALRESDILTGGDRIQVLFDPEGAAHVTIVGRDPSGTVERWGTVVPERPGLQPAPFALTLDATPGYQEIFVIGSPFPLTSGEIGRAVEGRPVPNGVTVESVLLPKR